MSVFTTVTPTELSAWLENYTVGTLLELKGISAGIENTNYFVTTTSGRYVLTLFEKLTVDELPYYLNLMAHLARNSVPCPCPVARNDQCYVGVLNGKPASLVSRVPGADIKQPTIAHCANIGALMAGIHIAGKSYPASMINPRGAPWRERVLPQLLPFMAQPAADLLRSEVQTQAAFACDDLPRGVIHADLFRDNVLWDGARVGGVIDFYFACNDALLYDVAITVNDWCLNDDGVLDPKRAAALLRSYNQARPFNDAEYGAWSMMLRAAALRFWMSRLFDLHLPRPGELTHAKDPLHFQRVLEQHIAAGADLQLSMDA